MASRGSDRAPALEDFQHASPRRRFDLTRFDPQARPYSGDDRDADRAAVGRRARELAELQNLF